jgi:hypothetical protein
MAHEKRGRARNPEIQFEKTDVDPGGSLRFILYLALATLVVAVLMRLLFSGLARVEAGRQPPPPIMQTEPSRKPPPPRLQEHEPNDLAGQRAMESAILRSYGWVDPQAGIVRIPIDEAMRLTIERGLPVRETEPPATSPPARPAPPSGPKSGEGP